MSAEPATSGRSAAIGLGFEKKEGHASPSTWDSRELERWIVAHATASNDRDVLLDGVCEALLAAGVPLWRVSISIPGVDPTARGFGFIWLRDQGPAVVRTAYNEATTRAFLKSPIQALLERDDLFGRWRLDTLAADADFPLLHELKAAGGTEYVLNLVKFAPGMSALPGVGLSFTTDDRAGFSDDALAKMAQVIPTFALAIGKLSLVETLNETLGTYLGPATGARVLDGQIRRGEGQTVSAAILITDLRGFTSLTDRADPLAVVGWLNEHFDALGDPVLRSGGEILKFLGDGFLAIFPVVDPDAFPCAVCESALDAAVLALDANRALNEGRRAAGLPELDADVVLHFGEVVYGNVGTSRRLDFTVIGRAVNEASRIEKLCGELKCSLLLSDAFASRCNRALVQVGTVPLRGLDRPQRVSTLAGAGYEPVVPKQDQ